MANQSDAFGTRITQAYAHETLTISTTALPGTASNVTPADSPTKGKAQRLAVTANDQPVRFTYNGTTPTAAIGHRLAAGETVVISGYSNILAFRVIREGGADSNVALTYER